MRTLGKVSVLTRGSLVDALNGDGDPAATFVCVNSVKGTTDTFSGNTQIPPAGYTAAQCSPIL